MGCTSTSIISGAKKRKKLKVLVIDTGVNYQIPEINQYLTNYDKSIMDSSGHGTHITGIIAKSACSDVEIIPCRGMGKGIGIFYSNGCLQKAIDMKVDIVNLSGGDYYQNTIEKSIISKYATNGILLVTAAGNANFDLSIKPYYPASYKLNNIIKVGALNENGLRATYSNYGPNVVWEVGSNVESWGLNGKEKKSGTSQAAANYTARLVREFCKE